MFAVYQATSNCLALHLVGDSQVTPTDSKVQSISDCKEQLIQILISPTIFVNLTIADALISKLMKGTTFIGTYMFQTAFEKYLRKY